jgi:hypothetical protein
MEKQDGTDSKGAYDTNYGMTFEGLYKTNQGDEKKSNTNICHLSVDIVAVGKNGGKNTVNDKTDH